MDNEVLTGKGDNIELAAYELTIAADITREADGELRILSIKGDYILTSNSRIKVTYAG